MKKLKFIGLLTSVNLLLSSLPGLAMEENVIEDNNLTYGRYAQKHIPHGMQSILLEDSENPEVMTFIFLQRIAQKAGTVDYGTPEFIKMVQQAQEGFPPRDYFLQNIKVHFFWIEKVAPDCFKESYEPHKAFLEKLGVQFPRVLSDIAKHPTTGVVKTPLIPAFRSLAVGVSEEGNNNSRNHDPHTTYMINLEGGHVQDDLTLLSSRKYLDLDEKPYEFDNIYVEVSASHKRWLFPEVLEFFNRHLIMGGKLILELEDDPNNPSPFETETYCGNVIQKWAESFGDGVSEIPNDYFGRILTWKTMEFRGKKSESLSIKYLKEFTKIKELLMAAGFDHIKKSDLPKVQYGTNPYEMLKVAEK